MNWMSQVATLAKNCDSVTQDELCDLFDYYQDCLARDEEELTFSQSEKVIKNLSIIYRNIKNKSIHEFFYKNVAKENGWL